MSKLSDSIKNTEPAPMSSDTASWKLDLALQLTGLLPVILGLSVLAGWFFEIPTLKSLLPGAVNMKANTAVGLLLSGASLFILCCQPSAFPKRMATGVALIVIALGLATSLEYLLGWQLGIDELLFKETSAAYSPIPGRMSPYTAVAFICLGVSLVLLSLPVLRHLAWIGASIVTVIGTVTLLGYFWNANVLVTDQWLPPVAIHTAFGFILLGAGTWLTARKLLSQQDLAASQPWSIEKRVLAGFIIAVVLLLGFGGYTYRSSIEFSESARWVNHTQKVRIAISELDSTIANTEATQYNYLLTGKAEQLNYYNALLAKIKHQQETLVRLVADNPDQLRNLEQLEELTADKLDLMSRAHQLHQEGEFDALKKFLAESQGIETTLMIHNLTDRIKTIEEQLLNQRQATLSTQSNITLASILLTLTIAASILVLLFQGISREIKARKKAEQRFEALLESAPDAMVIVDSHGDIVLANSQAVSLFGWSRKELLGQKIEILVPARYANVHPGHRAGFSASPKVRMMGAGLQLCGLRKDGTEFPVEISLSHIETEEGVLVCSAIRDITERKETENQIKALNTALKERAAEVEAINKELEAFSYSISHDLRAPLRHIQGYIEILRTDLGEQLAQEPRRYLDVISRASVQMGELIDGLLKFSRMGRVALLRNPVDLNAILHDAIAGLEMETRGRSIEWNIAPLPVVRGDAMMLAQVFVNLIGNAIKYTRPRDTAKIEVTCTPDQEGWTRISIRDNGVGFDMKYATKLFGVFQRMHRADEFEGTGIGLANVHRIINRHGGKVWAEATLNQGATFHFTLPLAQIPDSLEKESL